jgi:hypothetical protein
LLGKRRQKNAAAWKNCVFGLGMGFWGCGDREKYGSKARTNELQMTHKRAPNVREKYRTQGDGGSGKKVSWRDAKKPTGAGLSGVENRLRLTLFFGPSKAPSAFGAYYTRKEGGRQG